MSEEDKKVVAEQSEKQPALTPEEKKKKKEEEKKKKEQEKLRKEQEKKQKEADLLREKYEADKVSWEQVKDGSKPYGNYPLVQSSHRNDIDYTPIHTLNKDADGKVVTVRARIHTIRAKGKSCFVLLRDGMYTVQALGFAGDELPVEVVKFASRLSKETVIDLTGKVKIAEEEVKSATQSDIEINIHKIYCVSLSATPPISVEDAMRPGEEDEKEEAKDAQTESTLPKTIGQEKRLDNRVIDLRAPAHIAAFRIQSAVGRFFREFLINKNFTEIHTPKLIAGASEGGADVFKVQYFQGDACLAQSPQLYKQMAVEGDFGGVFEIGPVFRAENSNTSRHLTEFVGLDLETPIKQNYLEVVDLLIEMFVYIFDQMNAKYSKEIEVVKSQYPFQDLVYTKENVRLSFADAVQLLREDGNPAREDYKDFESLEEKRLGEIVREKYHTDFFVVDKYPMAVRPFYTMPCPENPNYSNSYDFFIRGQEILSGAQRIHDPSLLEKIAADKGVSLAPLQSYVDAFKYGAWPHAGAGAGLERVAALFLGVGNVRKTSLFPRDPKRLTP
ncbi:aspartyl-tRNA synthetase [Acrasis kona]|uniref:aspartate--tRNA ligase n=1 Tax=Acrasis kona TaxID=1008807 RepID=A0AAW2YSH8_9EUKA